MLSISKGFVDMSTLGGTELPSAWASRGSTLPVDKAFPLFSLLCSVVLDF